MFFGVFVLPCTKEMGDPNDIFLTIFLCLTLSVLSTVDDNDHGYDEILFAIEVVVVIWFSIEYCLRLWSSGCRSRYQGAWGRLKYAKRPFCIIDVVTVVASVVVLAHGSAQEGGNQVVSAVRSLRFFQILRMVRMDRRGGTWKLLGSVVYAHRQELITTLYIGFLGLIFSSFLVYLVEKDENSKHFQNFPDALWWGVITLCTVGYGDVVPTTWEGKVIASGCALLGITFFALPAGILGSGFALKVQQQQRQKHMIRRRQPAASLIQCLWRCYAADENSCSVATWKIHQVPLPSPPSIKIEDKEKTINPGSLFKHNASFVRLPTIRRHRNAHSPSIKGSRHMDSNHTLDNMTNSNKLNASHSEDSFAKDSPDSLLTKKNSDDEDDDQPRVLQLTPQHKGAIRSLRKIKYFVARRKFKEALKPYDVKDVIEQYSSGHADLLTRVKFLHGRLDQILGKQGSKSKDVYESKLSLASRIVKIERQVDDVESKLDQLIDLYMEDRKRLLALPALPFTRPDCSPPDSGGGPGILHHQTYSNQGISPNTSPGVLPHPYQMLNQKPTSTSLSVPGSTSNTNAPTSVLKPILVDKQSSEPNTPTSRNFDKPMTRGNSDISYKMKKRVTLSSLPSRHSLETRDSDFLQVPQIVQMDLNSAPYLDEDNDSVSQDDNCSTLITDCDSIPFSDVDVVIREESHLLKDDHPTIKEEPAFYTEETDLISSSLEIPTISASVETTVLKSPTTPTLRLFSEGLEGYSPPPHHPHLQHHQPSSQRRPSCTSTSSSLAAAEVSSSLAESFELLPTETTSFLPRKTHPRHGGVISTAICIEDTSS